ncbi:hypothetical protein EIP91_004798 [Steccherinum ochraceum]|uniref:Mini-chromosome maintenance complex-binding protein n=1 Tax=Steccherinum ochraceum TaxID=92696 RepID=A0A4R0RGH5_9APHY|nr:hypothetical protein EIP91_004798 [Steccherinum ochraceum]
MVSAYLADALRDPTGELQELYTNTTSDDFPAEVVKHFTRVFEKDEAFRQIPVLNLRNPPRSHSDRALVRFRAMVQDPSTSAEMYLARSKSGKLCGWGLEAIEYADHEDVDFENLRECTVLWAIGVPGESEWAGEELDSAEATSPSAEVPSPPRPHKSPKQADAHLGVQIKLYDGDASTRLKSTDVATFVGILSHEPLTLESDEPVTVPTLHALFVAPDERSSVARPYLSSNSSQTREELVRWLADEALGGDTEAAEWVLLSTISRVTPFEPESIDEDLHAGALQLPKGTVILVTEQDIQEGKLLDRGVMNVRALQEVMVSQTLSYSFPFSRFSFPTDLTCLVTTDGSRSAFFKTDLTVSLNVPDTPASSSKLYKPKESMQMPSTEQLATFRDYVVGARCGKITVSESTSEYIQQDFVRDRQQNKTITSDDLIRRMTVAKLYALSCHASELTIDIWERAKALDERRRARLV